LVLSTEQTNALASISMPKLAAMEPDFDEQWLALVDSAPAAASIPLLDAICNGSGSSLIPLNTKGDIWFTTCEAC
jgi:hypothetical protein